MKSDYSNLHFQEIGGLDWNEVSALLASLSKDKDIWIFRGQSDCHWPLSTTLERSRVAPEKRLKFEKLLVDQFKRRAHFYLQSESYPTSAVEWLSLMQHYGACTRLLDWTKSPYVAAFFSIVDCFDSAGCIWAINLSRLAVLVMEQFPSLFLTAHHEQFQAAFQGMADQNVPIRIEDEKIFELFENSSYDLVFPAFPYKLNERISSQQGIFLTPGNVGKPFEDCIAAIDQGEAGSLVKKIVIEPNFRRQILIDLKMMNINYRTLYPGLEGVIRALNIENIEEFA